MKTIIYPIFALLINYIFIIGMFWCCVFDLFYHLGNVFLLDEYYDRCFGISPCQISEQLVYGCKICFFPFPKLTFCNEND